MRALNALATAAILLTLTSCTASGPPIATPFTAVSLTAADAATPAAGATGPSIPKDLPWATLTTTTPAAPADPGTPLLGTTATPIGSGIVAFAGPSIASSPVAALPSAVVESVTSLPVIGLQGDFVQVLLPSRRHLPSEGDPAEVNHASGWVQAEAVTLKEEGRHIVVDRKAGTVILLVGGAEAYSAPIELSGGDASVTGRTFIVSVYSTPASKQCSAQPMLVTAHQSITKDEYIAGDGAAPQALHGFNDFCKVSLAVTTGSAAATPGCTIISDEAIRQLLAHGAGPGVPVIVY